jgi:hypothetical protein
MGIIGKGITVEAFINKITNTKTLLGITSLIIIILQNCGLTIDNDKVMLIVNAICGIGIMVGIFNKDGMETKKFNK